jgi:hypothetical protein
VSRYVDDHGVAYLYVELMQNNELYVNTEAMGDNVLGWTSISDPDSIKLITDRVIEEFIQNKNSRVCIPQGDVWATYSRDGLVKTEPITRTYPMNWDAPWEFPPESKT